MLQEKIGGSESLSEGLADLLLPVWWKTALAASYSWSSLKFLFTQYFSYFSFKEQLEHLYLSFLKCGNVEKIFASSENNLIFIIFLNFVRLKYILILVNLSVFVLFCFVFNNLSYLRIPQVLSHFGFVMVRGVWIIFYL